MLNYLKSEFYRILRSKGTYLFIIICSILLISSNVVLYLVKKTDPGFPYANTEFSVSNIIANFAFIYVLSVMVSGMIFNNENNNHTFKNSVSYGITRGTIYIGKLIIQLIYAIVAFTIIVGAHVGSAYLLLENSSPKVMDMLIDSVVAGLPLFLFVLGVANCFYFIMESSGGSIAATFGVIMALPITFSFLGMKFEFFKKISDLLPWNLLGAIDLNMADSTISLFWESNGLMYYWFAGIAQMLLFVILGYIMFNKKEIK